nr:AC4 [Tomato golden mottle virus]
MGNLISMPLSNLKEKSRSRMNDSSIWYPQPGQHISIRTFRELNLVPMSNHISTKMEIPSNGENFKSMADLLEEVSRLQTTHMPRRLTQVECKRHSKY